MAITRTEIDKVTIIVNNPGVTGVRKCNSEILDEKETIDIFCSDNPPSNDFEKSIRGVVFVNDKLIFPSFPYSKEIIVDKNFNDFADIDQFMKEAESNLSILKAIEGTLIRVFYYNKWFITTHRKLDAFKSKWGNGLSFGEIFKVAVENKTGLNFEEFINCLSKDKQYIFLVTSTKSTYFVCEPYNIPNIYLYTVLKDGIIINSTTINNIEYQVELGFKNAKSIVNWVNILDWPFSCQGILLLNKKTHETVKIINKKYDYFFKLRQNEPSIPFAYLSILGNDKDTYNFKKLYPHELEKLQNYDKLIDCLISDLYGLYIKRFIRKEQLTTDEIKHRLLKEIHQWYLTHNKNLITRNTVNHIIKKHTSPSTLNRYISNVNKKLKLANKVE